MHFRFALIPLLLVSLVCGQPNPYSDDFANENSSEMNESENISPSSLSHFGEKIQRFEHFRLTRR